MGPKLETLSARDFVLVAMLNPPVCREFVTSLVGVFQAVHPLVDRGFENPLSVLNEASRDPIAGPTGE